MKRISALLLVLILVAGLIACTSQAEESAEEPVERETGSSVDVDWDFFNQRAEAFITAMATDDFDTAHGMFDETMTDAMGIEALQSLWDDTIELVGAFIAISDIENAESDGYYISGVIVRHEDSGFGWNVVFSEDGLIAGLFTGGTISLPEDADNSLNTNEPVWHEGFTDYPITIGEGTNFPLPGLLSIPDNAAGPIPAVVIVHGSGPQDMDGTGVGSPYRDIAEFLATNGIAVIRHDKRTYTHGQRMVQEFGGSLTVWEEAMEDAIYATELLKADSRIDEDRIFLIGHSLGGLLAPRIHTAGGDFAGLILMGATPRPMFSEILIEQLEAQATTAYEEELIDSAELAESLAEVEALIELLDSIADMTDEEARSTTIFGASAYYVRDVETPSFADNIRDVTIPMLVMQGGRDFQIPADVDYLLFQEILAGRDNVTFKLYEDLNHSFLPSVATNFIEHANEITGSMGEVYTPTLQDIVDWINSW